MTAAFNGVPFRNQDVRFDVTAAEARAANIAQRTRLRETLHGLSAADWSRPSRCADWTVQHVATHLAQMNALMLDALTAASTGERFAGFATFDPRATPPAWVRDAAWTSRQTLDAYEASTDALLAAIAALHDDALPVATPAGRQPWPRAVLHALFDSAVHERDILAPFDRETGATADEVGPIAAYQLLLAARVACLAGAPLNVGLRLAGGPSLGVTVEGAVVEVRRGSLDGLPVTHGPADAVLDAFVGRRRLADALSGAVEAAAPLSMLGTFV